MRHHPRRTRLHSPWEEAATKSAQKRPRVGYELRVCSLIQKGIRFLGAATIDPLLPPLVLTSRREEMKLSDLVLRVVGGIAVIVAGLGLLYTLLPLRAVFLNREQTPDAPYFLPAFIVMAGICVACYGLLTISGIQFLRGRTQLASLFIGVLVFEVIYFFAVAALWPMPQIGRSVAAATGVANAGLAIQAMVLFPLWAPFAVYWAQRRHE